MRGAEVDITTPAGPLHLSLPLPGLYNVYNALAALAAALELGVTTEQAISGLGRVEAAFGRVETVQVGATPVSILLIKNPAGANEVLRTLGLEAGREGDSGLDLWIALNDGIADGRDVSWIWDADFELLAGAVRHVTCTGTRAPEMAVRLKYAGLDPGLITVRAEIPGSLDDAVAAAPGRLFALPTYTALLELRTLLADRGLARAYWE
jgi:UDP-N-acetylmuramyl tripeptide synthase